MQIITDTQKLIELMKLFDKRIGDWIFFKLWPRQVEFLDKLHTNRKVIITKKRQTGISQLSGADSLAQCMIQPNFTVLILSKTGPDAEVYLERVSGMYNSLPEEIKDASPCTKDGKTEMIFANGSKIISLPANRGAGYTADRVIIDEAAFITKTDSKITLETVLKRVEPTLDKAKGQLILISTSNGMNTFYKYWLKAIKKLSSFYAFFFSCWDDPTFTEDERDQKILDHEEDHVNQEYPRTWQESFLSSGRPRFDRNALQFYEDNKLREPIFVGFLLDSSDDLIQDPKGNFQVFQRYMPRVQYFIVVDVSEGIENELGDPDYSHAKVFRIETMEQVASYHYRIDPALLGTVVAKLGRKYNNAIIVVERNNHGIATLTQLRNVEDYPEILIFEHDMIIKEKTDADFKNPAPRLGWRTTAQTRPLIIDTLSKLLLKHIVPYISEPDLDELRAFVIKKGKAQAEEGAHDDRVIVLAIGYYLMMLDAFYQTYVVDEPEKWHCCQNCEYSLFEIEGEDLGLCTQSQRKCKHSDWCQLWSEYQILAEFDTIKEEIRGEYADDEYIPMGD